jgi:N-acetylmuramoyl-L-alanine amidase
MDFDLNDIHNLALVAWKEARGQGNLGIIYVMHVIVNRVTAIGFPKTLHDVIYQKNAFSSMTVIYDKQYNLQPNPNDPVWQECLADAPDVLNCNDDPTKGALYYANENDIQPNGWYFRNMINNPKHPVTVVLGQHTFRK